MLRALVCDVDGTITDGERRLSTAAIQTIRALVRDGVQVVLASGNTACFMDAACRLIGTQGMFIAENGGVYRMGYNQEPRILGERREAEEAFARVQAHFRDRGIELLLYSDRYRYTDVAFARTVDAREVREALGPLRVKVIDTGFAIHLQSPELDKKKALERLAGEMGLTSLDFMAVGDSVNDVEMIRSAGIGIAVANGHPKAKEAAKYVAEKSYGEGFVEGVERFRYLFL